MPRLAATVPFTDPVSFTANRAGLHPVGQPTLKVAVPFLLTNPVRITADGAQALRLAVPVTPFHALTLSLQVFLVESPTTITVTVETGMQNESEDGWQTVDSFSTVVTSPTTSAKVFTGLLRYVRYRVSLNGSTAITFAIQGAARGSLSEDAQRLYESALRSTKQCAGNCGEDGSADVPPGWTARSPVPIRTKNGDIDCGPRHQHADSVCQQYLNCFNKHGPGAEACDGLRLECDTAEAEAERCDLVRQLIT